MSVLPLCPVPEAGGNYRKKNISLVMSFARSRRFASMIFHSKQTSARALACHVRAVYHLHFSRWPLIEQLCVRRSLRLQSPCSHLQDNLIALQQRSDVVLTAFETLASIGQFFEHKVVVVEHSIV